MTASTTRSARKGFTLSDAWGEFWKHPSPWMIGGTFVGALTARIIVGDWQITDALVPVVMLALFPFFEWIIHVFILHWRPKHFGPLTIDPLLAREHRAHHVDPRNIPLIFIPWKALLWVLPVVAKTYRCGDHAPASPACQAALSRMARSTCSGPVRRTNG